MEKVNFLKNFVVRHRSQFDKDIRAEEIVYRGVVWNKLAYDLSTGKLLRFINLGVS